MRCDISEIVTYAQFGKACTLIFMLSRSSLALTAGTDHGIRSRFSRYTLETFFPRQSILVPGTCRSCQGLQEDGRSGTEGYREMEERCDVLVFENDISLSCVLANLDYNTCYISDDIGRE
jgi:hypothetical protein